MMAATPTLLGNSPAMAELRTYLPKVARSDATVLITGETGTGKERVADAIHRLSARRDRPFVAVNCAALPETLIESELFGHERGAYTGAHVAAPGRVAEAHHGTLFLDEIGEMNIAAQAKLLRLIETREINRVGASRPIPIDIRIVAATNQALEELVAVRRFRTDLYYRLNVARIELSPLRERPADIAPLISLYIDEQNRRTAHRVGLPDGELMECLFQHDWPGNVRELRNLVEAVFIDPPEGPLGFDHLPPSFRRLFARYRATIPAERERLVEILATTNWNKAEAAKRLNWSRMTLYRKLKKYHLETTPQG